MSLSLTTVADNVATVWLPTGIGIAALVHFGKRGLIPIALATAIVDRIGGIGASGIAANIIGHCLEAAVGAALITRVGRVRPALDRLPDVFWLTVLGGVTAALVSASFGALSLWLNYGHDAAIIARLLLVWWAGNLTGALVVLPLICTWLLSPWPQLRLARWIELLVLLLCLSVAAALVFRGQQEYLFTIFPWLIWGAVRFGPRGAAATNLVLALVVAWSVASVTPTTADVNWLTLAQPLLVLLTVATLTLGALIAERERATRMLAFLADASRKLAGSLDSQAMLQTVGGLVVPQIADLLIVHLAEPDGTARRVYTHAADPHDAAMLHEVAKLLPNVDPAEADVVLARVLRTGQPDLMTHVTDRELRQIARSPEHLTLLRTAPPRSNMSVPLIHGGQIIGTLTCATRSSRRQLTTDDLQLAEDLAQRVAQAIANAQLYQDSQEAARRSEEHLALLDTFLGSLPIGIAFLDERLRYRRINPALARTNGIPVAEHLGRHVADVLGKDVGPIVSQLQRVLETGVPIEQTEITWQRADRVEGQIIELVSYYPIIAANRKIGVAVVVFDITDRRRLERQLLQAQKLESVGRLAGGIAHDFNNILTAVIGYADLIIAETPRDSSAAADATDIRVAALRAARLTAQLLAFASKQLLAPRVVDLNTTITELLTMLRRLIGEGIALDIRTAAEPCTVRVDLAQFEQVIVNLVVNARDAMRGSGTLVLQTAHVQLEPTAAQQLEIEPGTYVELTVADTGHGMDAAVRQRIFEPFFTTKPTGHGSGLGLATSYGIVRQSGGQIDVTTELGVGTSFRVLLPVALAQEPAPLAEPVPLRRPSVGAERVLLVEDEDVVRDVALRTLRRHGYHVDAVSNPAEALRLVESGALYRPDLLLTDVVMPQMSGRELATRLSALYPRLRVLLVSGYNDQHVQSGDAEQERQLLAKPFSPDELVQRVRAVLDAPAR